MNAAVRTLAVLSLHTSPLAQPGEGDSGGMNVYVRELGSALAQAGVQCDIYTRRWSEDLPPEVAVEPGFTVVHVPAGPASDIAKPTRYGEHKGVTSECHSVKAQMDWFIPHSESETRLRMLNRMAFSNVPFSACSFRLPPFD